MQRFKGGVAMRLDWCAAAGVATIVAGFGGLPLAAQAVDRGAVVQTYADIAHAMYEDALSGAQDLQSAIGGLVERPSEETLAQARQAWLDARVPYQQTEIYRFGNAIVDDWEGRVNAWPLDEGLIDYVAAPYGDLSDQNDFYTANVIANEQIMAGGEALDASTIDVDLLRSLQEIDEVEANVATGYHAIEFLLWGQDLNGTDAGKGERPATDFDPANCTGGHCERRAQYATGYRLSACMTRTVSDCSSHLPRSSAGCVTTPAALRSMPADASSESRTHGVASSPSGTQPPATSCGTSTWWMAAGSPRAGQPAALP
jgi:uncharacterized iron-regulated protein